MRLKFYKFFIRHRLEYVFGLVVLFLTLKGKGWLAVSAVWLYLLPYAFYLFGRNSNWDANIAEEEEKGD